MCEFLNELQNKIKATLTLRYVVFTAVKVYSVIFCVLTKGGIASIFRVELTESYEAAGNIRKMPSPAWIRGQDFIQVSQSSFL